MEAQEREPTITMPISEVKTILQMNWYMLGEETKQRLRAIGVSPNA